MTAEVNLYDAHYGHLAAEVEAAVRRETWDEDLGQASWITIAEAREWFRLLDLAPGRRALEVACGSGGIACRLARETGASVVGVDINAHGIEAARKMAREQGLEDVTFDVVDAGRPLPFDSASFDALFCNDAINHLPDRPTVLRDWHRVLRPGGRLLFTDPIVVTGQLTNEEMRVRSSIGYFLFTPPGCNDRLLAAGGFAVREVRDLTEAVATVASRWRAARDRRHEALARLEGDTAFDALQRFLDTAHALAHERRLSRFLYVAVKTPMPG